jgi:hypothetical protein
MHTQTGEQNECSPIFSIAGRDNVLPGSEIYRQVLLPITIAH